MVGGDVTIGEGLVLDGALVLRAMPGASLRVEANLKVMAYILFEGRLVEEHEGRLVWVKSIRERGFA